MDYEKPTQWSEHVKGIDYMLTEEIDWGVGSPQSKLRIKIEKGTVANFSVPVGLRWLVDPHNPSYRLAAFVHDTLLHKHNWSRMRAGGDFHDALLAGGTPIYKALPFWVLVSVFKYPLITRYVTK